MSTFHQRIMIGYAAAGDNPAARKHLAHAALLLRELEEDPPHRFVDRQNLRDDIGASLRAAAKVCACRGEQCDG